MDGSAGARPDCNAHPMNYDEAVALCASYGYRLCTLEELFQDEITTQTGCEYSNGYNWVSDECDPYATGTLHVDGLEVTCFDFQVDQ